jgi:hypothetical protein
MPISVLGGLLVGQMAKKVFEQLWGVFDDEEAPSPKHREIPYGKLVIALLVEGAIFRLVRGYFDHAARQGFARLTGVWPGEEAPEPE